MLRHAALRCAQASVIVLCFALDRTATLKRVSTYWMPELRRLGVHVPVMLVGCKSDIRPADKTLHQVGRACLAWMESMLCALRT